MESRRRDDPVGHVRNLDAIDPGDRMGDASCHVDFDEKLTLPQKSDRPGEAARVNPPPLSQVKHLDQAGYRDAEPI